MGASTITKNTYFLIPVNWKELSPNGQVTRKTLISFPDGWKKQKKVCMLLKGNMLNWGKNQLPSAKQRCVWFTTNISKSITPYRQQKSYVTARNLWSCFNGALYVFFSFSLFCSYSMKRCWVITACWRRLKWKERECLSITLLSLSCKTFRRGISSSKKEQRYRFSS